ncbi:NADPH:quinone reductase-like Zn-dependent oxidoreductase [Lysobacter niastensis]|uniref:enoyl-[acyl-carrier-protein] reductase n=1 Tax=Lysobacter niastensis TaxID=380629 RepID=A0ABU1WB96_9GAMM|nr:zinc-dependent alcohol dehydrogenase family protein [Lysobacter niastensis]MDR7134752.1 NADPH:quinone reductase-like Zn-dependent oxidoreductase [Lysobacter niastensis]
MRQARYTRRGPVPHDVIEAVEFTLPPPEAGQVLVEVMAAPINPSDVLTLTGQYGSLPPLPAVGGNEGVGRVVEAGPRVTGLKPGQSVLLPVGSGTWTTHMLADAKALVALPEGADFQQLSMLSINPPTAALLLRDFVELQPGEWVVQNAANSAVGGYLVQLAKARGLRTVNVVRRESARAPVEALGGDVVLLDGDDLAARVREATGGARIALAVDAVGGMATEHLAQALTPGGTVVNYGAMGGEACALSPASLIFRDIRLRGFWLARWFREANAEARGRLFAELVSLIASGRLRAHVQATYGIDEIRQAVAAAASGERSGKILVLPNG